MFGVGDATTTISRLRSALPGAYALKSSRTTIKIHMISVEQRIRARESEESEQNPASFSELEAAIEPLTLSALLMILKIGRRTILFSGLGVLALATVLAFLLPLTYSATTSFVPPGSSGIQSSAALMGQLSALGGGSSLLGGRNQGDLYVGILKSHTIARYLVEHYDLEKVYKVKKESIAEKILQQHSLFETSTKDPIVIITVTDGSPERVRDLANGYLKALQETSSGLALTESSQRRLFFETRLAKEKDDLADAEVAMKQAQEHTGLIAPGGQTISQIQTMAQLNSQIMLRQTELAGMLSNETNDNPDVVRMRNEIGSLQAQLKQLQTGNTNKPFQRFSTSQVPELELEYVRRARDVKYHESLFEIIAKQYEAARLDEAKDTPLQVLDHAIVPDSKSGPHRSIIMAIGLLIGLLGGAVWVLMTSARRTEVLFR